MRYEFFEIFYLDHDGSVCSDFSIRYNGITVPAGTCFRPGQSPFSGIDIGDSIGRDVQATLHNNTIYNIEKIY